MYRIFNRLRIMQNLLIPTPNFVVFVTLLMAASGCGPGPRFGADRPSLHLTAPLLRDERRPDLSEESVGASGPREGPIYRGTARFKKLVRNYNPDVDFKNADRNPNVRIMSKRCQDRVNTLAVLVASEWPAVRLRVIKSWDRTNLRKDALHSEGRAVDITTSDIDRRKYGKLASLAVDAGFDWVHFPSSYYVHASVSSDDADSVEYGGCFPAESTVSLKDGRSVSMGNLSLGDQVLAVDRWSGQLVYSEVISFMDKQRDRFAQYFKIETDKETLELTGNHMLYVIADCKNATDDHSTTSPYAVGWSGARAIFASDVVPGQCIFIARTSVNLTARLTMPSVVKGVRKILLRGAFAPLTSHGTLVVDNIVASCYGVFSSEHLAHMAFLPLRLLKNVFTKGGEETSSGIDWYSRTILTVARTFFPRSWFRIR